MPPYTSGPRKAAYALLLLCALVGASLSACKPDAGRQADNQGVVIKVKRGSESVTGATFLTIDYRDNRPNHTESYADNDRVAGCRVGSVWPRCVK